MSYHIQLVLFSMFLFLITPFETKISFSYRPAIVRKYKVRIDTGKEDCYHQYVNPGANFYISFQVYTD